MKTNKQWIDTRATFKIGSTDYEVLVTRMCLASTWYCTLTYTVFAGDVVSEYVHYPESNKMPLAQLINKFANEGYASLGLQEFINMVLPNEAKPT